VVARREASLSSSSSPPPADAAADDDNDDQRKDINRRNDEDDTNPEFGACIQRIWKRKELYKGVGPLITTLAISNFVFFGVNSWIQQKMISFYGSHHGRDKATISPVLPPPILSLLASCLAGMINVVLTNPLWVTNLRIITNQSTYNTLWEELVHVSRTTGGIQHLWHGTGASMLLVSNPIIQFFCYEQIKAIRLLTYRRRSGDKVTPNHHHQQEINKTHLSPLEAFLLGAFAKGIATVVTYPLQLAQSVLRLQLKQQQQQQQQQNIDTQHHTGSSPSSISPTTKQQDQALYPKKRGTILQCLWYIYKRDGWRGLYTGLNAKLVQTILTAAFTFLTYEQILAVVNNTVLVLLQQQQTVQK
jgi:adenine nucleotide transporter 17